MIVRTLSVALLALPLVATAATYGTIDSENSQIQFHYQQMGVGMEGTFNNLTGSIEFDSNAPEQASVELVVKMNSVDTGLDEADSEVQKKAWFNADDFPEATFTSTNIVSTGDNQFDVTGLLSIKGHEQEVQFPATVTEANNTATFEGSFSLLRGDYAIGEGSWSKYDIVANDIQIDFTISATE